MHGTPDDDHGDDDGEGHAGEDGGRGHVQFLDFKLGGWVNYCGERERVLERTSMS